MNFINFTLSHSYSSLFLLFILSTLLKILLVPGYKSTDFEVHRNWLAITHQLPIQEWYYDKTSEWTLDYPPFFAYFEYLLSHLAKLWDPKLLYLGQLTSHSTSMVYFQRSTVMISDFLLFLGLLMFGNDKNSSPSSSLKLPWTIACLILLNPGLLIVDHVHFQYNGLLFGILLLTLGFFNKQSYRVGAAFFTCLLLFKHLFLYIAPAIFVYLLSAHCFEHHRFHFYRFFSLGLTVLLVTSIGLIPFLHQLPQLINRLFPFKRGLCHAYWAPNLWALYLFLDRVFSFALRSILKSNSHLATATRGLVGDTQFSVLPTITPLHTFIFTLILMLPFLWNLWKYPTLKSIFIQTVVFIAFVSFLVGWHVHEKAILTVWIPFSLVALESLSVSQMYFFFSALSTYSLFPLLFEPLDIALCWTLLATFLSFLYLFFYTHYTKKTNTSPSSFFVPKWIQFYLLLMVPLECFRVIVHPLFLKERLAFLPLMLVSVYCAFGFFISFCKLSYLFFRFIPITSTSTITTTSTTATSAAAVKEKTS